MKVYTAEITKFWLKFKHSETKVSTSQNVSTSRNAHGVAEQVLDVE